MEQSNKEIGDLILRIQNFFDKVLRTTLLVCKAKDNDSEYVAFLSHSSWLAYTIKGLDTADFQIWKGEDGRYGFSFIVLQQGVYMRKNGTGEPDSYDWQDHETTYTTLKACLLALVRHIKYTFLLEVEQACDHFEQGLL